MKRHEHIRFTHCTMGLEMCKEGLCGPVPIILSLPNYVVVYSTWMDPMSGDVRAITPFDAYGIRLILVPIHHISRWLTRDQAVKLSEKEEARLAN